MKILVVDKDDLTNQLMMSKLSSAGHEVIVEPNKNAMLDKLKTDLFDCIMLDPSPLSEARPVVLSMWKNIQEDLKPYLVLLTKNEEMTTGQAILSGTNDFLLKPLNMEDIKDKIYNAQRFLDVFKSVECEEETPSLKSIINKKAFYQLFLSALDRAYRYGERSLIVFVNILNYAEIQETTSAENLEFFHNKIAAKMNLMRRQSDVVGYINESNFAILLQRPQYDMEPLDAVSRFTNELERFVSEMRIKTINVKLALDLVEIPQGILHSRKKIPLTSLDNEIVNK